jgi:hypothetical protein
MVVPKGTYLHIQEHLRALTSKIDGWTIELGCFGVQGSAASQDPIQSPRQVRLVQWIHGRSLVLDRIPGPRMLLGNATLVTG